MTSVCPPINPALPPSLVGEGYLFPPDMFLQARSTSFFEPRINLRFELLQIFAPNVYIGIIAWPMFQAGALPAMATSVCNVSKQR
jgi:hypothetical protein